jgi:hypothetical protein
VTSKAIHQLTDQENAQIFAWARYVYWADVECQQYDAYEPPADEPAVGLQFVLMLKWYASLYVAIEGWSKCPLSDATVDELLRDPAFDHNLQLLRRFRNGVYHYQPELINDKLLGFLREATQTVAWAFLIHSEFKRVLWEFAHPPTFPPEKQTELVDLLRGIIGWLPNGLPEAAPHNALQQFREAMGRICRDGSQDTPHAKELLDAARDYLTVANQAAVGWAKPKRAMIDALKQRQSIPVSNIS